MGETKPRAGRPRSEASRLAILEAALELALEHGYASLTMDKLASEAGVGKQTLYRWWPSRAAVLLEAMRELASREIRSPDTGALERDVERFMVDTFAVGDARPGLFELLSALMAEAQHDRAFAAQFREQMIEVRRKALRTVLERARRRGELDARADLDTLLDLAYGPMWYRLLLRNGPLDRRFAAAIARAVARAGRPRETSRRK